MGQEYGTAAMVQIPLIGKILTYIVNPTIALLFTFAVAMFFWGVFEMVYHADSEEARSTGKEHMLWGIVGFILMITVVGLLQLICNTVYCQS